MADPMAQQGHRFSVCVLDNACDTKSQERAQGTSNKNAHTYMNVGGRQYTGHNSREQRTVNELQHIKEH